MKNILSLALLLSCAGVQAVVTPTVGKLQAARETTDDAQSTISSVKINLISLKSAATGTDKDLYSIALMSVERMEDFITLMSSFLGQKIADYNTYNPLIKKAIQAAMTSEETSVRTTLKAMLDETNTIGQKALKIYVSQNKVTSTNASTTAMQKIQNAYTAASNAIEKALAAKQN